MRRAFIPVLILSIMLLSSGCQTTNNSNAGPGAANANSSPLPPGISTSPLPPGGTPTPGIPDVNAPKNANQPAGTPTPGIPDLKSQNNNSTRMNEKNTPSKGAIETKPNTRKTQP